VAADETLVLTDANNTLNKWQEEEAFGHWKRELICPLDSPNSDVCRLLRSYERDDTRRGMGDILMIVTQWSSGDQVTRELA
jgi:hypothetical protein